METSAAIVNYRLFHFAQSFANKIQSHSIFCYLCVVCGATINFESALLQGRNNSFRAEWSIGEKCFIIFYNYRSHCICIDIFTKFSSRRRVDASRHTARETPGRCDRDREAETHTHTQHTHGKRGWERESATCARDFWYDLYIQSSWSLSFRGVRYSRIGSLDAN